MSTKTKTKDQAKPKAASKSPDQDQLAAEIAAIGKIERREYDGLKRRCIEFEKKNCDSILIIPCSGDKGWCEMGDRSAILYKYFVCEKIGANVTLADDYDSFFLQYRLGRVRTRGFSLVKKRIKASGLYASELTHDKCVMVKLKRKFTPEEMLELEKEELARQLALNEIVKIKPLDPMLYQAIVELAARIHRMAFRHMDKVSSATNGRRVVALADSMQRDYLIFSEQYAKLSPTERLRRWQKMLRDLELIRLELQIIATNKIWNRNKCAILGDTVVILEDRLKRQISHRTPNSKAEK